MRFVTVLLAVVAVYLGCRVYSDSGPAAAGQPGSGELYRAATQGDPEGEKGSETRSGDPGDAMAPASEGGEKVSLQAQGGQAVADQIRVADATALRNGFRAMLDAKPPRRPQIEAALLAVAGKAEGVGGLLAVLGDTNAFLHTASGRKLARKAMVEIRREPRETGLQHSTALLTKCTRGSLTKADTEAFDLVNELYGQHRVLVDQVVFNPSLLTKARSHQVQSGETLDGIAAKFRKQGIQVEGWTLCLLNRIGRPNRLQAGKTIKIPTEPIRATLEKESFTLSVFVGENLVRMYWVGHGKETCETPETTFTVIEKLPDPDWDAPDGNNYPFGHPKNVLGRYFLKFGHPSLSGFGAHGTAEPATIRTRSSLGCIRMKDADIEEFFRFFPRQGKVTVLATR